LVPLDRLVIETDSPCLVPVQLLTSAGIVSASDDVSKITNEPAFISVILKEVARLRGEDLATLAAATYRNACATFRCDPEASASSLEAACSCDSVSEDGVSTDRRK
jgi:Tat protein secretion system quality control protein TatD with DNase activity